jgi:type IV pilus assembly protein PilO
MNLHGTVMVWRERLLSPLGWHLTGCATLLVLTIGLGIRLGLDWRATNGHSNGLLDGKQVQLAALDLETAPLRGLNQRVGEARIGLVGFYSHRIPPNYSAISGRIGELGVRSGVRLARVQYTQGKPGSVLTEISMDASISGLYPEIMRFVNSIERDPEFLLIREMAFTGQQGGQVNLRIHISTWLRPADALASGLPATPEPDEADQNADKNAERTKEDR